jgi:membrane protease YdiL (CAAX protease family)
MTSLFLFSYLFLLFGNLINYKYMYLTELVICIYSLVLFKNCFRFYFEKKNINHFIVNFILGVLTLWFAKTIDLIVPFSFENKFDVIMLILLGPLLEECIFRLFIYFSLNNLLIHNNFKVIIVSIIFSLSHFKAYFYVDDTLKSFIIYQSIYTLIISFLWTYQFSKDNNITTPIISHVSYNFGFYIGLVII